MIYYIQSASEDRTCHLNWENCDQQIDLNAPELKEPILFYDEVFNWFQEC